ncbi:very long chain fatty acid elongase 2-like isoform X2 [Convolutriloba macropyga]|uniref:very long chain fatty acid elongase 2-like isoform X2 n=1 Tax=Convolutriloba macropyga TaxID=536237 RepID=UPI003F524748
MSQNTILRSPDLFPVFDDRTKGWEIVQVWFLLGMLAVYLLVCRFLKQFMQTRPAFEIKGLMVAYNIFVTALSAYMFHEFFRATFWTNDFSWFCQPLHSVKHIDDRLLSVCWWYYASKFVEFFDTWFMLLRKKFNQVSFLHLYHHSSIALMTWYAVVFVPGGSTFFAPLLNCFVHTVMYFYYLLSAIGVNQKYLWWKKYITKLQLTQFTLILAHSILGLFIGCGFPRHYLLILFFYNVSMFWLFSDFYTKSYNQKKKTQQGTTVEGKSVESSQVIENGSSVVETPSKRSSPRLRASATAAAN